MYSKEFRYAQQFIKKVTGFELFSGHHQTCISEPTKGTAHFRAIIRHLYQNPRKFRPIFGPSSDLYIRTHESSGPFLGHHQKSISEPTKVPAHFWSIVRPVYQNSRKKLKWAKTFFHVFRYAGQCMALKWAQTSLLCDQMCPLWWNSFRYIHWSEHKKDVSPKVWDFVCS